MASIFLEVDNNLYTVSLDQYEWNGLTVTDGAAAPLLVQPQYVNGRMVWLYKQTVPGKLSIQATANGINIANPRPQTFILPGIKNNHKCTLSYSMVNSGFVLNAVLTNVSLATRPNATNPAAFNQYGMTGLFMRRTAEIALSSNNQLYSVLMGGFGWTGLSVVDGENGDQVVVPPNIVNGETQWQYTQASPGHLEVVATAAPDAIQIINPESTYIIPGAPANHSCFMRYEPDGNAVVVIADLDDVASPATDTSPVGFLQGHMAGSFFAQN